VDWLNKISITCFAASYLVVFLLEVSRVFFRARFRRILLIGFAAAGLFAHTVYLFCQSQLELDAQGIWLGSWFGWCLTTAWLLAAAYLWISIRQPESIIGLFVLPIALALIWIGIQFGSDKPFTTNSARSIWNMIHGISLLLGTVVVALGFIFGVVYLWQAHRLKRKLPQLKLFRLPSLEWLQQSSERSLVISAVFLAIGLLSGIAINQVRAVGNIAAGPLPWSDPVVWSSGILFAWLLAAMTFNLFYRPAREGRKVAYLVVTSFLFLLLELAIVWWAGHATVSQATGQPGRQASASNMDSPSAIIGDDAGEEFA
jgi:ABC-type uncharacterized transport system permease subunit